MMDWIGDCCIDLVLGWEIVLFGFCVLSRVHLVYFFVV